jgi:hypothetical protein
LTPPPRAPAPHPQSLQEELSGARAALFAAERRGYHLAGALSAAEAAQRAGAAALATAEAQLQAARAEVAAARLREEEALATIERARAEAQVSAQALQAVGKRPQTLRSGSGITNKLPLSSWT